VKWKIVIMTLLFFSVTDEGAFLVKRLNSLQKGRDIPSTTENRYHKPWVLGHLHASYYSHEISEAAAICRFSSDL
jgi:hypothetical protein